MITLGDGVVVLQAVTLLPAQLSRPSLPAFGATVAPGGYLLFAETAVGAVVRDEVLDVRPGSGTLGGRAVLGEMDGCSYPPPRGWG